MAQRIRCDICNASIPPHAHYVVRMDVFADPSLPELTSQELEEIDFDDTFTKLIEQMKHMTPQELEEQVHKRFEFRICPKCQREFLANPLGLPRVKHGDGNN
jgi:translation initiation factor IF-2